MSDIDRVKIEKIDSSYEALVARFALHVRLLRPQPGILESTTPSSGRTRYAIVLPVEFEKGSDESTLGIVAERQDLLELGRQIVRALDPSQEDEILAELRRIRKLMEKNQ